MESSQCPNAGRSHELRNFFLYGIAIGLLTSLLFVSHGMVPANLTSPAAAMASAVAPGDLHEQFDLSGLLIDKEKLLVGGPPKDGIPSITDPKVTAVKEATFLENDDRVIGVTINKMNRAYPIRLLNYHEVVNDTLGGVPIAVIYCPLCDSVSVVDRRVDDMTVEFGISGLLHNSNVVMYDRTENALWSQVAMKALSGPHAGFKLHHVNTWQLTTFSEWTAQHPDATVATFETSHNRNYKRDPYAGYAENDELYFPVEHKDKRLPNKARVLGVQVGERTMAVPLDAIREAPGKRLELKFGDDRLIFVCKDKAGLVDVVESPPNARVVHTFWFAWAAFHPDTELYNSSKKAESSAEKPAEDH